MYFKDWYRITLNGGMNPRGETIRDLTYPWPTELRARFKEFVFSMLENGEAERETVMHSCEWDSCGWLEDHLKDYYLCYFSHDTKEHLKRACQEWITFWDESTQEFKFPDKRDYEHLWTTPCEL